MAKLKIGSGIQLEAKLPEVPEIEKSEPMPAQNPIDNEQVKSLISKMIKISDRTYQNNDAIEKLQQDLGVLEEKVDGHHDDMLHIMDAVNEIDVQPIEMIKRPEIKSVTIHRDHTKDFEDIYQKLHLDKDDHVRRNKIIKNELDELNKKLKTQKKINICFAIAGIASLIIHLF